MTTDPAVALIALALEPRTRADAERLARALEQLTNEQIGLSVGSAAGDPRVVIEAADDRELEVIVDRGRGTCEIRFDGYRRVPTDEIDDGNRDSPVTSPLRPVPTLKTSSVALLEPDEDPQR